MSNVAPQRPVKAFRAGTVKIALWRHENHRDGQPVVSYSARIQKRYLDRDTNSWVDTEYLQVDDLARLAMLARKAFEYAVLKEESPGEEFAPADAEA